MANIHVKPNMPRVAPPKGEESEARTWYSSSGDPIKGMPSAKEPMPMLSDKARAGIQKAFGHTEDQFINNRKDCGKLCINGDCEYFSERKTNQCMMFDNTYKCGKRMT